MKKKAKKASKPAKKSAPTRAPKVTNNLGRPYGDRILVKPAPMEETTSFGLVLADTSKEKPEQGTVVAVGDGKQTSDGKIAPLRVKVGDRIMFSKYGYDEVKIDGTEYYLIREDSITYIF
jgi:chaperonin GroES